jgi:hypothetical protein
MTNRNPVYPSAIIALTIALSLFCQGVQARDYQVEVVIFERSGNTDVELEVWNFSPENLVERQSRLVNLSANASQEIEFDPVLTNLATVQSNLVDSGIRILRSASWIQPPEVFQNAPLVSLGIEGSSMPYGFIKVYRTSLIFVDIDLQLSPFSDYAAFDFTDNSVLTDSAQPDIAEEQVLVGSNEGNNEDSNLEIAGQPPADPHYFISEKRRVKFKEFHYFDHPRFGAIVGVWPIADPQ